LPLDRDRILGDNELGLRKFRDFRILVIPNNAFAHPTANVGAPSMNRFLLISLLASAGAWILIRTSHSPNRVIPVAEAAAKLQQAWADHHTTA
jgi:hypothetical protein